MFNALVRRYAIEREIGAGGMATVYLARDLRHDRQVALKVLKPELGAVLGVERFLSEIKVTANLHHPNLLPLFDSGEVEGLLFYVMPFVEGETLRARLNREKQMPIDEALRITVAIASALDYAHRHGVIHRDLKPENVLLHEGQPLVADFGIALAVSNAGGQRITQTGLSLGTPNYMSPEQAMGDRQIDGRTDIYSLAVLVYEMLTGEPPHLGNTAQVVIARLLTDDPRSVREIRSTVPAWVDAAIMRGLAKIPADRFATAKEFGDALVSRPSTEEVAPVFQPTAASGAASSGVVTTLMERRRRRDPVMIGMAAALLAALGTTGFLATRPPSEATQRAVALSIESTPGRQVIDAFPASSPDGRLVAFAAESAGVSRLYLHALDQFDSRALQGTERVFVGSPVFFSPDGGWLGFVSDGKLKRVHTDGSQPPEIIADASDLPQGGSWSPDGSVIFAPDVARGLMRYTVEGGAPTTLTTPDRKVGEIGYAWPDVLPNGKGVLYGLVTRTGWSVGVYSFASKATTTLIPDATMARYVSPGWLLFVKNGRLYRVGFDEERLSLKGTPSPVALDVAGDLRAGGVFDYLSASAVGTLSFVSGPRVPHAILVRVTRAGVAVPLRDSSGDRPRVSPDGQSLIAGDSTQLSLYDLRSGTRTRVTAGAPRFVAVWSPDGKRIVYTSYEDGNANLSMASLARPNESRRLIAGENRRYSSSWSAGGDLDYMEVGKYGRRYIWVVHIVGDSVGKPVEVVSNEANDFQPAFSPDGKWLAYASDRTGAAEVYVQPYPAGGTPRRVSTDGGSAPVWNRNGHELFYRRGESVMSVAVTPGASLDFGAPKQLFAAKFGKDMATAGYDVLPDGQSFVAQVEQAPPPRRVNVVVNWRPTP